MKEIFNLILRVFSLKIPIPISFENNYIGYINVFGLFMVIIFIVIISYILYRLFK